MLATAGIVGSGPWSAGGPVGGDTMGECDSAWTDEGECVRKMDAGLSTGVKVCMAPGGDGTGVEAIPIYVEELLLLLTCCVEGTS